MVNMYYLLVERIQRSDFIIRFSDRTQTLSLGSSVTLGKLLYLDFNVLISKMGIVATSKSILSNLYVTEIKYYIYKNCLIMYLAIKS